ncbi:MAG: radical SAM protein [Patescibacteria group bacterium]
MESVEVRSIACPQECSMCSFSCRSKEASFVTQPDVNRTPEEFKREAQRQVTLAREHNPHAKIAFKVTHIGRGIKGNKRLCKRYVEILKAVRTVEGINCVDACLGLLDWESARAIAPYVDLYNNNLERIQRQSRSWVTDQHTLEDKVETLRLAKRAGMKICSGILVGAGESAEDKIDILLKLRELAQEGIIDSSPLNCFTPIYPSDLDIIAKVSGEDCMLALCLARIMIPHHHFFPNAGRFRFGRFLPAMHAIASGYSSHHNYLTKFVNPDTDLLCQDLLKEMA